MITSSPIVQTTWIFFGWFLRNVLISHLPNWLHTLRYLQSCSIKRPGLNLPKKSLFNDQVHLRKNRSSWFIYVLLCLLSPSNVLVWIFGKSLYQRTVLSKKFSNPRCLEWPGIIIATLKSFFDDRTKLKIQSNLVIRNVLIRNKLALRNLLWITNPFIP